MKRIFFVEDDASLRSGLTFALEKQGYAVTAAATRAEAESFWRADAFDLVILDVSLPDGSAACRWPGASTNCRSPGCRPRGPCRQICPVIPDFPQRKKPVSRPDHPYFLCHIRLVRI